MNLKVFVFAICVVVSLTSAADDGQCSEAFDKSAVTPEAAKEAAKVKSNPPVFSSDEVYSSKVKSNFFLPTEFKWILN